MKKYINRDILAGFGEGGSDIHSGCTNEAKKDQTKLIKWLKIIGLTIAIVVGSSLFMVFLGFLWYQMDKYWNTFSGFIAEYGSLFIPVTLLIIGSFKVAKFLIED
jgi:magnesium-transporting ATPase (P-type)